MRAGLAFAVWLSLAAAPVLAQEPPALAAPPAATAPSGEALYMSRCATCHGAVADAEAQARAGASRIPARVLLEKMPPEHIVEALTFGPMVDMALGLSDADIASIATYLTKKPVPKP